MDPRTHFSFEVYYPAHASSPQAERDALMDALGPVVEQLLQAKDSAASVAVSDSPKGREHKLIDLITSLQDAQIAEILQTLSMRHGVSVTALE